MLTLYFAPGSSSMAPHIALHEIGVRSRAGRCRSRGRRPATPAYLALNPEGKVPTLLIDGRPLTEVAAILFYLAQPLSRGGLAARGDIEAEAQAVSWMSFIAATVTSGATTGARPCAQQLYGIADRRLGARLGAGRYSIADIHLFRLFWRFRNSLNPAPAEFPNLSAHYERMMARPAVKRTCEIESAIGYDLPA